MRRIIFIGNPGVGKGTLLNSLLGEVCFHSGVTIGSGLTRVLQTVERNQVLYTDTPGLDDLDRRAQAALEISRALRVGGEFTLIFVATLEAGRVRPADLATIDAVLTAVESVGVNVGNNFSLIINKCDTGVMQMISDDSNVQQLRAYFSCNGSRPVSKILFFPEISHLVGITDGFIKTPEQLTNFVYNECPAIRLPCSELLISVERFDARMTEMQRMVDNLEQELKRLKNEKRNDLIKQLLDAVVGGASTALCGVFVERALALGTAGAVATSTTTATSSQSTSVVSAILSVVSWFTRSR